MVDSVDYAVVLADLKARRARLDQLIGGIEATILGQADGAPSELDAAAATGALPATIHPDTFFGLSIIEAAKKFLRIARRAQHTTAIAEALAQGGLKRPSDGVLSSILIRAAKGRELTKVGKGMWGLSEWYPKVPKDQDEPRRRRPETKKSNAAKKPKAVTERPRRESRANAPRSSDNGASPSRTALEILQAARKPMHLKEIIRQLGERGITATRATLEGRFNQLARNGKLTKSGPGTFAVVAA